MNQVKNPPTTLFSRLLEPLVEIMPVEFARELVGLRATPEDDRRIEELADKSTEGQLTAEERAEYAAYLDATDLIGLLQLRARSVIRRASQS